jgi:hypothetical protein
VAKGDIMSRWYEDALGDDNALCAAEKDAKQRGTWFSQIFAKPRRTKTFEGLTLRKG